jgi:hypothetical protein
MPIGSENSRWANTSTPNPHEARVTATVGAGREVVQHAGENTNSPARTYESRIAQAV